MPITLNGTTGEVPASWTTAGRPSSPVAGQTGFNTTLLTLEVYSGSVWEPLVTTNDTGTVTPTMLSQRLTQMTSLAYNWNGLTNNTVLDFTGIPSWAKRVTVMVIGVSLSGTALLRFRLGTSGGFVTSGYLGSSSVNSTGVATAAQTAGIDAYNSTPQATALFNGSVIFTLFAASGDNWVAQGVIGRSDIGNIHMIGGSVPLGGTLTQVRVTSSNGTDTFDAGTVNVMYEG